MTDYRLMSTRHHRDGSIEPPSATAAITAADDAEAVAVARRMPLGFFAEDADFAWLVDDRDRVVGAFPIAFGQAG